ncbi:MAG: outer membrane beta-barrel domain-containing protein, partial [Pseudomonadota bacterium]
SEFEKESGSVVRNKLYYKPGKFELAVTGGLMPYDDVNNQYFVGGKATWHLTDSVGWEIADVQKASASITSWANNLVNDKNITDLQTAQLDYLATSNLIFSPFYGKIRVFGSSLVFFDLYTVLGAGVAGTKTVKLSKGNPESTIRNGLDPVVDFGIGFKFFLNRSMGLVLDLRDYLTFSETYGKKSPKSNYTVFVGLNFFIPSF